MSAAETVAMTRDAKKFPESHEAIVAAEEVDAFKAAGWTVAKGAAAPAEKAADEQ